MASPTPAAHREALLRLVLRVQERQNSSDKPSPMKSNIVNTAMAMFTRNGYAGTSMRDIAGRIGIKAASLYSHFPGGKDDLLVTGLNSILGDFHAFVIEDIKFDLSAAEQLRSIVARHVRWQLEFGETAVAWDAAINQFGVADALPEPELAEIRREQALYLDLLTALAQETSRSSTPAPVLAAAIILLCNGAHRFLPVELQRAESIEPAARDAVIDCAWDLVAALLQPTGDSL